MQHHSRKGRQAPAYPRPPLPRAPAKRVRIIKKVRIAGGVWKFISLDRLRGRYVWDRRPGYYFVEWWEGKKRRRERGGLTPAEALEAQRRKTNELIGELAAGGKQFRPVEEGGSATRITDAIELFADHIRAHSPAKPRTLERYREALAHFERLLGKKKYVEAITRSDIDDYKITRSRQTFGERKRPFSPATINFEVNVLRTFFYYLTRERGIDTENPCARFKPLRVEKERLKRRPPTYSEKDISRLFPACDPEERAMYATLLLTGLRKQELRNLAWDDVDLKKATVRIRAKEDFAPKDYEERDIPIPPELVRILQKLPKDATWVFPSRNGKRLGRNEMLRRLKVVAARVGVKHANLHKFRHTYATRLLESGCDIVTVQDLLGHSDLDTTRKYLSPDDTLKRRAVNKLTLK